MTGVADDLRNLSDEVWSRTRDRLQGLGDDEYLWEPVAGCWSLRRDEEGRWRADGERPGPDPAPFTTIAWRVWHLIDLYGEDRGPEWLAVEPQGEPIGLDGSEPPPGTASEALAMLDRAHDRWHAHLALVDDSSLAVPIGPVAGPYAEASRAAFVLHMLDEFIHHGAELALLRDLWRATHGS